MKNNNSKKVRNSMIKESLLNYNNLAQTLKENTKDAVQSLLNEQVRKAYADILNESDDEDEDKDYDVEEVDDVQDETEENEDETAKNAEEGTESEDDDDTDDETEDDTDEDVIDDTEEDEYSDDIDDTEEDEYSDDFTEVEDTPNDDKEAWSQFDDYKVSDDEYDFRNAKDDDIVKVYKLLKDEDQVKVVKNGGKVNIKDNENGTEYIIDMDATNETAPLPNQNETENMNESLIFELVLNEDAHKSLCNTKPVVGKNAAKPWNKAKKKAAPFTVGTKDVEESSNTVGALGRMMGVKSHKSNSGEHAKHPAVAHNVSVAGEYKGSMANESILKKANKVLDENKKLKESLKKLKVIAEQAAVTNVNLGGIIKLMTENTTTAQEKKAIVKRFTEEVHTINESKDLYKKISSELGQKVQPSNSINEDKSFSAAKAENINENKIYQDDSVINSITLMKKICK